MSMRMQKQDIEKKKKAMQKTPPHHCNNARYKGKGHIFRNAKISPAQFVNIP